MVYLIKKSFIGSRNYVYDNAQYEVINTHAKYFSAGEVYNSDNYVYCDKRNTLYHRGLTIDDGYDPLIITIHKKPLSIDYKPFIEAVFNYKLKLRQSKLNKI